MIKYENQDEFSKKSALALFGHADVQQGEL
jgi:hypothetical protein